MSSKLKIAFYTDTFLPAHDGVVRSTLNFRKELMKRGHEVYVFAGGDKKSEEIAKRQRNVHIVKGMRLKSYPQYSIALPNLNFMMAVKDINPDIIHAQTPFTMGTMALAIAKINKVPIVGTFHTLFMDTHAVKAYTSGFRPGMVSKYAWKYARFYYNRCNRVIAPTESIRVLLDKKHISNSVVVPNGINLEAFNGKPIGEKVRRSLLVNKNEKIILYLGRVGREKRLETLLSALKHLKEQNVRVVIAGTGPASQYYSNLAKRLGVADKVSFTGFVKEREVQKYYAACDAFCIPSTFETQGIAALEALAMNKPVIAADSRALHDLIKNGKNGEKFTPGDSHLCANKIKKVLNNIGSYKEMRNTADQYSNETATDKLIEVYDNVLKNFTL